MPYTTRHGTHTHTRFLLKQETVSGSGISWAICKSAPSSRQTNTPAPHHSFYKLGDLPATQPTASKHWRQHGMDQFWWTLSSASRKSSQLRCCPEGQTTTGWGDNITGDCIVWRQTLCTVGNDQLWVVTNHVAHTTQVRQHTRVHVQHAHCPGEPLVIHDAALQTATQTSTKHTATHIHLTALWPGLSGWAGTRKVKPIWILLKQDTVSGSGISWAVKSATKRLCVCVATE